MRIAPRRNGRGSSIPSRRLTEPPHCWEGVLPPPACAPAKAPRTLLTTLFLLVPAQAAKARSILLRHSGASPRIRPWRRGF